MKIKIFNNEQYKRDVYIFFIIVIILGILISIGMHSPGSNTETSFCKPNSVQSGSYTAQLSIPKSANYAVWIHLETPIQIDFNTSPDNYNPLYFGVDNNYCYMVGGEQYIPQNTWTWVNSLNNNSASSLRVYLTKGTHTFQITGLYISIDQVRFIRNNCVPINTGQNCPVLN